MLWQYGKGDMTSVNPAESNLIRAANMREWTSFYRHDLARSVAPEMTVDPHGFLFDQNTASFKVVSDAVKQRVAAFFVSDGTLFLDVNFLVRPMFGTDLFEIPDVLTEKPNWMNP